MPGSVGAGIGRGKAVRRMNLAITNRTAMAPYYRSDSMYMERMRWEAAVDRLPEALAGDLRNWFATARSREGIRASL